MTWLSSVTSHNPKLNSNTAQNSESNDLMQHNLMTSEEWVGNKPLQSTCGRFLNPLVVGSLPIVQVSPLIALMKEQVAKFNQQAEQQGAGQAVNRPRLPSSCVRLHIEGVLLGIRLGHAVGEQTAGSKALECNNMQQPS